MTWSPWIGTALVVAGVLYAPRGVVPTGSAGERAVAPTSIRASQVRRWVWVETPPGADLQETLTRFKITARSYVCRRTCRDANLPLDQCAHLQGAIWVAAGTPPPTEGPDCDEDQR
jgi:hypothetical protein